MANRSSSRSLAPWHPLVYSGDFVAEQTNYSQAREEGGGVGHTEMWRCDLHGGDHTEMWHCDLQMWRCDLPGRDHTEMWRCDLQMWRCDLPGADHTEMWRCDLPGGDHTEMCFVTYMAGITLRCAL